MAIEHEIGELLEARGLTFAAAESCSGGKLADLIVTRDGASKYFLGSVVSYSNQAKVSLLGVSEESLSEHGAVSEEVAREMAIGIREATGASVAVSITGIAGPSGGSAEKPVGTFCVGLIGENAYESFTFHHEAPRDEFRLYCARMALDLVKRAVLGEPLVEDK